MIRYPLKSTSDKLTDLIVSIRWDQSNARLMHFQGIRNIVFISFFRILFASMRQGIVVCGAVLHSPFVVFLIPTDHFQP
jgi:hypothetical protein